MNSRVLQAALPVARLSERAALAARHGLRAAQTHDVHVGHTSSIIIVQHVVLLLVVQCGSGGARATSNLQLLGKVSAESVKAANLDKSNSSACCLRGLAQLGGRDVSPSFGSQEGTAQKPSKTGACLQRGDVILAGTSDGSSSR